MAETVELNGQANFRTALRFSGIHHRIMTAIEKIETEAERMPGTDEQWYWTAVDMLDDIDSSIFFTHSPADLLTPTKHIVELVATGMLWLEQRRRTALLEQGCTHGNTNYYAGPNCIYCGAPLPDDVANDPARQAVGG